MHATVSTCINYTHNKTPAQAFTPPVFPILQVFSESGFLSRVECQMSSVEGQMSRVEGKMSRVEGKKSRVEGKKSRVKWKSRGSQVFQRFRLLF